MSKKDKNKLENLESEQLAELSKQITGVIPPTGNKRFRVFPIESGAGKTNTMIDALVELYRKSPEIKSLVITLFKGEAVRIANAINDEFKNEEKSIAVNIDCDNQQGMSRIVNSRSVLIITHSRYQMMCDKLSKSFIQRMHYFKGRTNLIIDEEMELLVTWTVSKNELQSMSQIMREFNLPKFKVFHRNAYNIFKLMKDCWPSHSPMNMVKNSLSESERTATKEVLKAALRIKHIGDFSVTLHDTGKKEISMKHFKEMVNKFYNIVDHDVWIFDKDGISSYNDDISFLMAANNIILDASASMNSIYAKNKLFDVVRTKRTKDHSHWVFSWWNEKSTKSYKSKHTPDFYIRVGNYIARKIGNSDKALILCYEGTKEPKERDIIDKILQDNNISQDNYEFTNFWAMRGKNDWADFNQCFIIHTPYEPYRNYVFRYLLYHKNGYLRKKDLYLGMVNGKFGFINNNKLEAIKESSICCSIYQGVKRIDRNRDKQEVQKPVYVMLVCSPKDTCRTVEKELINVQRKKVKEEFVNPRTRYYPQRPHKYVEAYFKLADSILNGPQLSSYRFEKSRIAQLLGCSKLYRDVLSTKEVKRYNIDHNIKSGSKYDRYIQFK